MPAPTNSQVAELKPAIAALEALGCQLVSIQDQGAFGFVAAFKKEKTEFSVVKDRGYWHLAGDEEELNRSPSRKSRHEVTDDAIAWIKKQNA